MDLVDITQGPYNLSPDGQVVPTDRTRERAYTHAVSTGPSSSLWKKPSERGWWLYNAYAADSSNKWEEIETPPANKNTPQVVAVSAFDFLDRPWAGDGQFDTMSERFALDVPNALGVSAGGGCTVVVETPAGALIASYDWDGTFNARGHAILQPTGGVAAAGSWFSLPMAAGIVRFTSAQAKPFRVYVDYRFGTVTGTDWTGVLQSAIDDGKTILMPRATEGFVLGSVKLAPGTGIVRGHLHQVPGRLGYVVEPKSPRQAWEQRSQEGMVCLLERVDGALHTTNWLEVDIQPEKSHSIYAEGTTAMLVAGTQVYHSIHDGVYLGGDPVNKFIDDVDLGAGGGTEYDTGYEYLREGVNKYGNDPIAARFQIKRPTGAGGLYVPSHYSGPATYANDGLAGLFSYEDHPTPEPGQEIGWLNTVLGTFTTDDPLGLPSETLLADIEQTDIAGCISAHVRKVLIRHTGRNLMTVSSADRFTIDRLYGYYDGLLGEIHGLAGFFAKAFQFTTGRYATEKNRQGRVGRVDLYGVFDEAVKFGQEKGPFYGPELLGHHAVEYLRVHGSPAGRVVLTETTMGDLLFKLIDVRDVVGQALSVQATGGNIRFGTVIASPGAIIDLKPESRGVSFNRIINADPAGGDVTVWARPSDLVIRDTSAGVVID